MIENKVKESPFVEQLMVLGENEKFVSALICPSFDNVKDWCSKNGVAFDSKENVVRNPKVLEAIQQEIDKYNVNFGKVEQIKKFKLLANEWSVDGGELTPTMKVKRKVVMEKYKEEIADIYSV